jgi:hypothetical protein
VLGQVGHEPPGGDPLARLSTNASASRRNCDDGRTGRLFLNLLLVRLGYPPAIMYRNQRTAYLRALRRADQGEPGALGELIARAILDNLYKFVVPAAAEVLR